MRTRAWLLLLLLPAAPVRSGEGDVRLLTDDAIPRYLARGQVLARNEEWEKVVDVLHRVVIGDKEVFPDLRPEILHSAVYSDDGQLFYPARELCLKELSRLPPAGLRAYRNAHDREARELFAQAEAAPDLEERLTRYAGVYDTFLPSSVADDALEEAGDINLALGRYYEALALFRRLIDVYPKDTDRPLGMVLVKAAYCAARIGDREHRNVLLERLASEHADARLRIEGRPARATELREHPLLKVRGGVDLDAEADWPLPGGDATRARIAEDLPENLPRKPLWTFSLADRDAHLRATYAEWLVQMHDREAVAKPSFAASGRDYVWPYPTVRPVVHDGVVFYKDYVETVARRIGSGTLATLSVRYDPPEHPEDPRYRYPARSVRPGSQGNPKEAQLTEDVYRHYDYGGNTIVIGDGRVVVVEQRRQPAALRTIEPIPQRPNLLVAYERGSGKTSWAWHMDWCARSVRRDAAQFEAWQRDFQNHPTPVFMGPGVIAGGILYTVAHEKEELAGVSLWAINVRDGRVRFRTPLHYADEVRKKVPRGASVAVAGGVVYAVTHGGIVAAVDALPPGRVRWIRRYRRNYVGRRGRKRAQVNQGFAYNDPVVSGGKVIVMAADAEEVVALDAETGRIAWTHSKASLGSLAHIVGVSDGVLVLAGEQVLGVDLARGTKVWGPQPLHGWPRGRGVIGAKYVYVPTRHEAASRSLLERFGVADGERAAPLQFDVPRLGNLVISEGRLVVANSDEVMCFTTQAAELERIDARIAKQGARSKLLFERALIALAGDTPRRDRARADFLEALDAAAAEGRDDRMIRAHAIENLLTIADQGSDLAALDEARGLVPPANPLEGTNRQHHPYEAQIALARVELLGRVGRGEEALTALERFLDLHGRERVRRDGRVLDGAVAAGRLRDHLLASSTAFQVAFSKSVRGRIQAAFRSGNKEALRTIPERYEFKPPSEEAYFAHARLCEDNGELAEAEQVLRGFITRFKSHRRRASAHLHLARILVRQAKPLHARRERYEGISRLDETGRAENAKLLQELDELLRSGEKPRPQPRIRIPLASRPLDVRSATPVPLEGDLSGLPEGYTLFSGAKGYFALDGAGQVLWTQPDPAGSGAAAGPVDEPDTLVIAAAIAAARLAVRDGDDLILGDVAGVMRLNALTGKVAWRYPARANEAQAQRDQSLALLRSDLRMLRTSGYILRRHPLPAHTLAGGIVVRMHVMTGVDGLDARTGRTVLFDPDIRGAAPVGPPAVMGELLAVGWSKPGRVRVYHLHTGKRINDLKLAVLFAPPVIDPLGRVVIIGAEREGHPGDLSLVNARLEEPAHPTTYRVPSTNAATLYADGRLVIYHDGSSGTKNLHFLDLEKHTRESYAAADLMRDFRVLRDGSRLFVFTSDPGLEDEGARLFRIDIPSREVLSYNLALKAHAYSRPVVTQRYIALAAALPRSAHVRLFDRDASRAGRDPYPVFAAADGQETATLDFPPQQGTDYGVPPALALSGDGFVVGHPFGTARLLARDAR